MHWNVQLLLLYYDYNAITTNHKPIERLYSRESTIAIFFTDE